MHIFILFWKTRGTQIILDSKFEQFQLKELRATTALQQGCPFSSPQASIGLPDKIHFIQLNYQFNFYICNIDLVGYIQISPPVIQGPLKFGFTLLAPPPPMLCSEMPIAGPSQSLHLNIFYLVYPIGQCSKHCHYICNFSFFLYYSNYIHFFKL